MPAAWIQQPEWDSTVVLSMPPGVGPGRAEVFTGGHGTGPFVLLLLDLGYLVRVLVAVATTAATIVALAEIAEQSTPGFGEGTLLVLLVESSAQVLLFHELGRAVARLAWEQGRKFTG